MVASPMPGREDDADGVFDKHGRGIPAAEKKPNTIRKIRGHAKADRSSVMSSCLPGTEFPNRKAGRPEYQFDGRRNGGAVSGSVCAALA